MFCDAEEIFDGLCRVDSETNAEFLGNLSITRKKYSGDSKAKYLRKSVILFNRMLEEKK